MKQLLVKMLPRNTLLKQCLWSTGSMCRLNSTLASGPDQILPASDYIAWTADSTVKLRKERVPGLEPMSVPTLLKQSAERFPNNVSLAVHRDGDWKKWTFSQYYDDSRTVAKAMIELGLNRFHAVNVIGFNAPEYYMAYQGAIMAGGLAAGIYMTNNPQAVHFVSHHSKGQIAIVEDDEQLQKYLKIRKDLPDLKTIVQYTGTPTVSGVLTWNEFLKIGQNASDQELDNRLKHMGINQACLLIYTSGTTGNPKGVMLSHDNITTTARIIPPELGWDLNGNEKHLSYFPLNHVGATMLGIFALEACGGANWFAEKDALKGGMIRHLHRVRPTQFITVPRVYEKIREALEASTSDLKGPKKALFNWAQNQGKKKSNAEIAGKKYSSLSYKIADKFVLNKIREKLGLDNSKGFVTAAAPNPPETVDFYKGLNMIIREFYACSESSCDGTRLGVNIPMKEGTVGLPYKTVEVRIDQPDSKGHGEICMRGRNVMMGYLNDEKKTKETIDGDGWLYTGDLGSMDEDGYLSIQGRIKELIITSGGENIGPTLIEETIKKELPCLSNAMVIGDKRKYLTVILTLKTDMDLNTGWPKESIDIGAQKWLKDNGLDKAETVKDIIDSPQLRKLLYQGIDRANNQAISNAQRVQKFILLDRDFCLPGGELTPTLKTKRSVIENMYKEKIDQLYE